MCKDNSSLSTKVKMSFCPHLLFSIIYRVPNLPRCTTKGILYMQHILYMLCSSEVVPDTLLLTKNLTRTSGHFVRMQYKKPVIWVAENNLQHFLFLFCKWFFRLSAQQCSARTAPAQALGRNQSIISCKPSSSRSARRVRLQQPPVELDATRTPCVLCWALLRQWYFLLWNCAFLSLPLKE